MKKVLAILMVGLFVAMLFSAQSTVTITRKAYGGMSTYSFSFTDGAQDTAIIVPSGANYFNVDVFNRTAASYYLVSGETSLDSIRWNIERQVKSTPAQSTWRTVETIGTAGATGSLDSSLTAIGSFNYDTYGRWPIERYLLIGSAAKNAEQTVTGYISFKKD